MGNSRSEWHIQSRYAAVIRLASQIVHLSCDIPNVSRPVTNSKLHRFSITSTVGGLTNTVFGPLCGLRTTCLLAKSSYKNKAKPLTDQATVINTMINTLMLHRKKKTNKTKTDHVSSIHTHIHTNIFKYSSVIFNYRSPREVRQKCNENVPTCMIFQILRVIQCLLIYCMN